MLVLVMVLVLVFVVAAGTGMLDTVIEVPTAAISANDSFLFAGCNELMIVLV